MRIETRTWGLVAILVGIGLTFSPAAYAEDEDDVEDLDSLSAEELKKDLVAELDDVLQREDLEDLDTHTEVVQAFLAALSDEGDDDSEDDLDYDELAAEMKEAGTTISTVVNDVVAACEKEASPDEKSVTLANSALWNFLSEVQDKLVFTFTRDIRAKPSKASKPAKRAEPGEESIEFN